MPAVGNAIAVFPRMKKEQNIIITSRKQTLIIISPKKNPPCEGRVG
jgi:hypothetical protein